MVLPTFVSEYNDERQTAPCGRLLPDSVPTTLEHSRAAFGEKHDFEPVSIDDPPLTTDRQTAPGGGRLDSMLSILENVSALCDDDVESPSLHDTVLTFHPWWLDQKRNQQDPSFNSTLKKRIRPGSCSPSNTSVSLMFDLARILEPRPLPPSFHLHAKGSSSPGPTCVVSSSKVRRDDRSPTFQDVATKKTNLSTPEPVSCSSSSPIRGFANRNAATASSAKIKSYNVYSTERRLPQSFVPGPYTVVIGRGREARQAPGNLRLCSVATTYIDQYSSAGTTNKSRKSQIVASICRAIRSVCPEGAFVRVGPDGRWYEVPDSVSMEKVGYTLRELVGERYRSSSKAKKVARQESFATCTSASSHGSHARH
jgi:hypothetical protein